MVRGAGGEGWGSSLGYGTIVSIWANFVAPPPYEECRLLTDEQLLADYARGAEPAIAELIGRYQQELFAFLFRFVSDAAAADDLFQETFVQVHRNAGTFDPERRFRPWLFTIAANKARDFLRSNHRRHTQSLDHVVGGGGGEDATTFLDLMQSEMAPPPIALQNGEDVAAVQQVLAELTPMYKEVLVMSYFHQFSYKEMAEMLRIPLGTVKSRLHAALAAFARAYKAKQKRNDV